MPRWIRCTWNCGCGRSFRMGGWANHRRLCLFACTAWPLVVEPPRSPSKDPTRGNRHENRDGSWSSGMGRGAQSHGFWNKVRAEDCLAPGGCWIWTGYIDADGAGKFCTLRNRKQVTLRAARVAWEELRGPIPRDKALFADCGVHACVNPDHRRLIPRNMVTREIHEQGRRVEYADNKGEMSGRAKLREEDVLFIRAQPREYGMVPLLARLYGVSPVTIGQVRYGRTWRHLGKRRANATQTMSVKELRQLVEMRERDKLDLDEEAVSRRGDAA